MQEVAESGGGGVKSAESGGTYAALAGETLAALDLGTNNCRLLVARAAFDAKQGRAVPLVIDSFSRIVRLGEGVSQSGALSADAMARARAALDVCRNKLDRHRVTRARFVATEACRRAANAPEFLDKVARETGLQIDIISTEEEAQLAFLGCASLLREPSQYAVVFDIGGGSTEFLWVELNGRIPKVHDWFSLPYGVMNLSEKFGGGSFADLYFEEMVDHLMARLQPFNGRNEILGAIAGSRVQMLSTSGTVTTLAALHLGLPRYDRTRVDGISLPVQSVRAASDALLKMRPSERFHQPCIGADRSDFIIYGCAIFEAIARLWPVESITIADRGLREGIILSFIDEILRS